MTEESAIDLRYIAVLLVQMRARGFSQVVIFTILWKRFKVRNITQLPESQYRAFVVMMRVLCIQNGII
jgi:hypothetical protein